MCLLPVYFYFHSPFIVLLCCFLLNVYVSVCVSFFQPISVTWWFQLLSCLLACFGFGFRQAFKNSIVWFLFYILFILFLITCHWILNSFVCSIHQNVLLYNWNKWYIVYFVFCIGNTQTQTHTDVLSRAQIEQKSCCENREIPRVR